MRATTITINIIIMKTTGLLMPNHFSPSLYSLLLNIALIWKIELMETMIILPKLEKQ